MQSRKLYIIGNGFDLHHGLKCNYSDFAGYLKHADQALFDTIEQYMIPEEDLWSCLEQCFAWVDIDQIQDNASDHLYPYSTEKWSDSFHHDYEYEIEEVCKAISLRLRNYFADWVRKIAIPAHAIPSVQCIDTNARFLNFNYTSTLQSIYQVPNSQILHIHGSALKPNDEIVLGHGWQPRKSDQISEIANEDTDTRVAGGFHLIDKLLSETFKPSMDIISKNSAFFDSLKVVNEVFVLGHSLSDVDELYFKEVLDAVGNQAWWRISYYRDLERAERSGEALGVPSGRAQYEKLANM